MASRNTGHVDPRARPRPTLTAVTGLILFLIIAGAAAYLAARAGVL